MKRRLSLIVLAAVGWWVAQRSYRALLVAADELAATETQMLRAEMELVELRARLGQ